MGTYLSTPVLDKHTEKGSDLTDTNTPVRWAVVDMQGWRKSMEDAHVARTDVTLPSRCFSGGGGKLLGNADGGDGGSGGEGGAASASATIDGGAATAASNNDNDAASIQQQHQHAKVFAVFDGHGGAEVARYCQLHLVPVLTSQSQWKDSNANEHEGGGDADDGDSDMSMASCIGHALIDSFHALDRMIDDPNSRGEIEKWRSICNLPDHPIHAGCTSVVAVIVGRTLVVANAGDSRAVLCRAGGLTEPLSFDHKPLQNREMNRITNSGGFVNQFGRVNGNLNLSRSIGDLKYKQVPGIPPAEQMITAEPDILCTTLRAGDEFIVLGCDGIWDCLTNEECVKYVRDRIDSKHPHEIGMEMLDEIVSADPRASQGIGGDNMTIMIVDLLPHSRPYHGGGSNE
ncbi:hypothetical protein ACHAXR_012886 [Thalassiosira sp. AJA248-18]